MFSENVKEDCSGIAADYINTTSSSSSQEASVPSLVEEEVDDEELYIGEVTFHHNTKRAPNLKLPPPSSPRLLDKRPGPDNTIITMPPLLLERSTKITTHCPPTQQEEQTASVEPSMTSSFASSSSSSVEEDSSARINDNVITTTTKKNKSVSRVFCQILKDKPIISQKQQQQQLKESEQKKPTSQASTISTIPNTTSSSISLKNGPEVVVGNNCLAADRESIISELECTVCQEIILPPILHCPVGQHLICSSCLDGIKKRAAQMNAQEENNNRNRRRNSSNGNSHYAKCPTCRESMVKPYRNLVLERLASKLLIRCRHVDCNAVIPYNEFKDHLNVCDYRPIRCHQCYDILNSWEELWTHKKTKHATKLSKQLENQPYFRKVLSCKAIRSIVDNRPIGYEKCFAADVKSFYHKKENISIHINPFFIYMEDTKTLLFGIWEMGPTTMSLSSQSASSTSLREKQVNRHEVLYEIMISSYDKKIQVQHSSIQSISYRIHCDDIVKYGNNYECLRMSSHTIQRMSYNFTQNIIFHIKPLELEEESTKGDESLELNTNSTSSSSSAESDSVPVLSDASSTTCNDAFSNSGSGSSDSEGSNNIITLKRKKKGKNNNNNKGNGKSKISNEEVLKEQLDPSANNSFDSSVYSS